MTAAPRPTAVDEAPGAEAAAVIVVGSLHYDIMVDAPGRPRKGETLAGRSWAPKFGGKGGNQAVAARRQRVSTAMVGAVGKDSFGEVLLASLDRAKVDRRGVAVFDRFGSGMSVAIFDDEGDYGAVIVSGANLAITPTQQATNCCAKAKFFVLRNAIPELVNEAVARRARERGLTIIINAAPARAFATSLADLIDVLVVNSIEAEMLGGCRVSSLETAAQAAAALASRFRAAVVTAGADGVAFAGNWCAHDFAGPAGDGGEHPRRGRHVRRDPGGAAGPRRRHDRRPAAANREAAKLVATLESARTF